MADERTYGFSRDDADALVQSISNGENWFPEVKPRGPGKTSRAVILDAALAVATDSKTGATSALATVCDWSTTDDEYTESDPVQQITVYNHSESTSYSEDTFGVAQWINGHWWFFGDCAAMAAR